MSTSLMANYGRFDLTFERGEGSYLYTADGERYLDFGCGIGVTSLGHAHPHVVAALEGSGQAALARLQPLPHSAPSPPCRATDGRIVCRPRALLQFRRRGGGVPALKLARIYQTSRGRARALPRGHLPQRLPRANTGDHRGRRAGQAPQGLRARRRRLRPGGARRSRRDPRRRWRGDGRDHGRAGARRGRGLSGER